LRVSYNFSNNSHTYVGTSEVSNIFHRIPLICYAVHATTTTSDFNGPPIFRCEIDGFLYKRRGESILQKSIYKYDSIYLPNFLFVPITSDIGRHLAYWT
jgi:hypothetical protein